MATAADILFLRVFEALDESQSRWCAAQEALSRGEEA
jgi:hypothetical protein